MHILMITMWILCMCTEDDKLQAMTCYLPVSHCVPDHPMTQVQVFGEEQVPPFRQGLLQVAAVGKVTIGSHFMQDSNNYNIDHVYLQHTPALRYTPTPESTGLAGSTV